MLKRLENYFLGRDVIEYYKEIEKAHPEHIKTFEKDKNKYLICGKIIPDIIDISSIVLGCYSSFFITAGLIGVSEGIRQGFNDNFQSKKVDYEYLFFHEKMDKLIDYLEKHPDIKIEIKNN